MGKYFGTDGIRGVAGRSPLTAAEVQRFARAAADVLRLHHPNPHLRVLIVRDTRASGPWLADALAQGLQRQGVDVYDAGVLSTPAVAYLVKAHRFDSGVVISASHNPPVFNGIKFFTSFGTKWPDPWENLVEKRFDRNQFLKPATQPGLRIPASVLAEDYKDFVVSTLAGAANQPPIFNGLKIAVDCGHGATVQTAPEVFRRLGATIVPLSMKPTGWNINVNCGSQHTEALAAMVTSRGCHAGAAFDGDGDRVILMDENGRVVDGDHVLGILGKSWRDKKALPKKMVIITVMANLGLKKAFKKWGVRIFETAVGDRHVSEAMRHHGAALGGEQSGHIILGPYLSSGDGLLTAVHVLATMKEENAPLSKLAHVIQKYPQVLKNLKVAQKPPLAQLPSVRKEISKAEKELGSDGRVLVRYSGTEPLLRIMLEGPSKSQLDRLAGAIADAAQSVLG